MAGALASSPFLFFSFLASVRPYIFPSGCLSPTFCKRLLRCQTLFFPPFLFPVLFSTRSHPLLLLNKEQRKMDKDAQQHPTATSSKAASKQLAKI